MGLPVTTGRRCAIGKILEPPLIRVSAPWIERRCPLAGSFLGKVVVVQEEGGQSAEVRSLSLVANF